MADHRRGVVLGTYKTECVPLTEQKLITYIDN